MGFQDWLTVAVAFLGVSTSGLVAYLAYSFSKQAQRAQVHRDVGELYDKIVAFRAAHPQVLQLSRQWTPARFENVYSQAKETDRQWALYYTYADLCLGFCNAVLYGHKSRLLDRHAYQGHLEPLVKLILTENDLFIRDLVRSGKYISRYVKDFRRKMERSGWDWAAMHTALASGDEPNDRITPPMPAAGKQPATTRRAKRNNKETG